MATTIKKAVEAFVGHPVSEDDFVDLPQEVIKLELTFANGLKYPILLTEDIFQNYSAEAEPYTMVIYDDPIQYFIDYDNSIVIRENLNTGIADELIIEDVKCLNKSQVTLNELLTRYESLGAANIFNDTNDFQLKFGLKPYQDKPAFLTDDQMTMKIGHLKEELAEIEKAYQERDIVEVADGLIDLIYVAAGLAELMNLPTRYLWHDVQNSNMAYKERVTSLDNATKRGSTFDVRKTKNWVAPRGKEIIENAAKPFESWIYDSIES